MSPANQQGNKPTVSSRSFQPTPQAIQMSPGSTIVFAVCMFFCNILKPLDQHLIDLFGKSHANGFIKQGAQGADIGRAQGLAEKRAR